MINQSVFSSFNFAHIFSLNELALYKVSPRKMSTQKSVWLEAIGGFSLGLEAENLEDCSKPRKAAASLFRFDCHTHGGFWPRPCRRFEATKGITGPLEERPCTKKDFLFPDIARGIKPILYV